jgi:hypothetical protein
VGLDAIDRGTSTRKQAQAVGAALLKGVGDLARDDKAGKNARDGYMAEHLENPFVVALRTATNMEALMAEEGTVVGLLLGEDMIMRGEIERPGPPVEWNDEGTVCS